MKAEEIPEGNKLIHIWMGKSFETDYKARVLKYHTSFDWLIPVVEKIESLPEMRVHISIAANTCNISTHRYLKRTVQETKILAVWQGVVEFLRWYKEQK